MRGSLFADVLKVADGIDWKQVVIELAEKTPEVVAKVIAGYAEKTAWKIDVRKKAASGEGKIPAIKLMRELTGAGLREGKEWVESDPECCVAGEWVQRPMSADNPFRE